MRSMFLIAAATALAAAPAFAEGKVVGWGPVGLVKVREVVGL